MTETQRLQAAVNDFSKEMKRKLLQKKDRGFEGWDCINSENGQLKLMTHFVRAIKDPEQWVDVANFAMFLWYTQTGRDGKE